MKKILFIISFSALALVQAQMPKYYKSIHFNKKGNELKNELAQLIKSTHKNQLTYKELWKALAITDADPKNSKNVLMIYGYDDGAREKNVHRSRDKKKSGGEKGLWSREHVYPKSLGQPNLGQTGPGADAHMLRPADVTRNTKRSNLPFIDGTGKASKRDQKAWYPGNEWKGDIARIIMYMYVRYGNQAHPNRVAKSKNTYHKDMPDLFLKWNAEDPVSKFEMQRNEYLGNLANTFGQGNRNPFIDNPYLATKIWGGPKAQNRWKEIK